MDEAASFDAGRGVKRRRAGLIATRARAYAPTLAEVFRAVASALLLLLAFPDFDLWPLAWVALTPLLYAVASRPRRSSFLAGWLAGSVFFYLSCHWLTFPMIRYAGIPAAVAYALLLAPALAGGVFFGLFAAGLARACARWGAGALLLAPPLWAACEWARLGVIGQLWNALGYSQAFHPALIQAARFGGVYAVGFLVVSANAALAYALLRRDARGLTLSLASLACVALAVYGIRLTHAPSTQGEAGAVVVALQPNVAPDFDRGAAEYDALASRHFESSAAALRKIDESGAVGSVSIKEGEDCGCGFEAPHFPARVVVWPESPMNFAYERDAEFRERVARFVRENHASLLFNSLEPTKDGGGYNAAVLVNEQGRVAAQYDKIRLMPFGEYVPLPRWMPGAGLVRGVVGDFTPGERYTLMPLVGVDNEKNVNAGVFICLESAYPYITRRFAEEGADVLIEMTNDAYQGNTSIMRQHLSNAVFRAVETGRTLLRVTNTGISARVSPRGEVSDETGRFEEAARTWEVARSDGRQTFYTKFGDAFAAACALISVLALTLTLRVRRRVAVVE